MTRQCRQGSYSDIQLDVTGQDFIATVTVSGQPGTDRPSPTRLGSYTIFDLTHQKLGRSTVLHIPASDFRYLHFEISGLLTPESITGLSVVKLPATQPKYETVAESSSVTQKGHSSLLEFTVPPRVPVDRVAFAFGKEPASFSRDVTLTVTPVGGTPETDASVPPRPVMGFGNLLRVHRVENGLRIDEERLAIDAPLAVLDKPAKWTVAIDNGDDPPLPVQSVRLQMLQRNSLLRSCRHWPIHVVLWRSSPDCGSLRLCHAVHTAEGCRTGHRGTGATESRISASSRSAPAH